MSDTTFKKARIMNVKAVKTVALGCSKKYRAGKFNRVGQAFLDEMEASIENLVRGIQQPDFPLEEEIPVLDFVSGDLLKKVRTAVNTAVAKMIYRKVKAHPTVGKTLGKTTI